MKNIFIAIIVIVMLPLLFGSLQSNNENNNELKGFSARDIQYIESIGFVDNLDGSWTLTGGIASFTTQLQIYTFDFQPIVVAWNIKAKITSFQVINNNTIRYYTFDNFTQVTSSTTILWGGDVS